MSSRFNMSSVLKITAMALALAASVVLALAVNAYYGFLGLIALGLGVWLLADLVTVRDMERSIEGGTAPRHHELVGREVVAKHGFTQDGSAYFGRVTLNGESWQAMSVDIVTSGETVVIHARVGLVLHVQRPQPPPSPAHDMRS